MKLSYGIIDSMHGIAWNRMWRWIREVIHCSNFHRDAGRKRLEYNY